MPLEKGVSNRTEQEVLRAKDMVRSRRISVREWKGNTYGVLIMSIHVSLLASNSI
jgi:hypothetical protein